MKPIINIEDLKGDSHTRGEKFAATDAHIGSLVGAKELGYSLITVPPGKRAYPFHCHHVNEEMFFVIEGTGMVRIGDAEYPIRKGDVIAAPAGGKATAHQIVNTSDAELRYLAVSTMVPSEVVEYPDSGKVGIRVGNETRSFSWRGRLPAPLDYWEGE